MGVGGSVAVPARDMKVVMDAATGVPLRTWFPPWPSTWPRLHLATEIPVEGAKAAADLPVEVLEPKPAGLAAGSRLGRGRPGVWRRGSPWGG